MSERSAVQPGQAPVPAGPRALRVSPGRKETAMGLFSSNDKGDYKGDCKKCDEKVSGKTAKEATKEAMRHAGEKHGDKHLGFRWK